MNRLGTLALGIILIGTLVALPHVASAQSASAQQTASEQARVQELLKYARTTYDRASDQGQAGAQGQKTLEQRAEARPVMKLTADDAVARALENNIELSVERLNPQLQDLALDTARAVYKPTLTWTGNTSSNNPLPTSLLNGGTSVQTSTINLNTGITQPLKWFGGTASIQWNNPKTDTTSSFATLNPQFTPSLTMNYTQPFLRNFKIDSNRLSLKTTAISRQTSDFTLRARIINTEANTRNAYWDLAIAIRAIDAAKQSLDLALRLVEDNQTRVEVGTLAPMDVIQAQAEAATRRQTLTQAEATRRTAELALKRLIVSSTDDPIWKATIDPTDVVQVEPQAINLESAVSKALAQRTDLMTARNQLASNDLTITYLRNQLLPALDFNALLGTRGLGGNTFIRENGVIVGEIPGGWTDAMKTLLKYDYPNWTLGATFSYPLGQSAQKVAMARSKVQVQQATAQVHALELQVATDVTNAALNVESTLKRLDAARAARELSEKRLVNEQSKFEVGMSTNFFVVQAQRDLLDAQIVELRASLDYRKSLVEFERVQVTSASGGGSVTAVSR